MDRPVDIKFDLNLQNRCVLKIAQHLWSRLEAKREIRIFFENPRDSVDRGKPCSLRWPNLMKRVLLPIKMYPCPMHFKRLIQIEAHSLGLQIFHWILYVTKELQFDLKYALVIYYTPDGEIDKKRIFQLWLDSMTIETSRLFNLACFFCFEDCIRYLWQEMPEETKRLLYYERKVYTNMGRYLIAYWTSILTDSDLDGLDRTNFLMNRFVDDGIFHTADYFATFSRTLSIEENMFRLAICINNEFAVKYFSDKLTDEKRNQQLPFAINAMNRKFKEVKPEIVMLLTSKMTLRQNTVLCLRNNHIFEKLLSNSKCEQLFMTIVDSCLQYFTQQPDSNSLILKLFEWISRVVSMMRDDFLTLDSCDAGRYQRIFQEIWKKLTVQEKIWMIESFNWELLLKLLDIEDFGSLRLIINDSDLSAKRKTIISYMMGMLEKFNDEKRVCVKKKFADKIGLDDEEKHQLRKDFFCD